MKELIIHYMQQVLPYFSAAAAAFIISCLLTPLSIRVAGKIGAMDVPKDNRRMHTRAMPRFGGMAIFAGTEISLAIFCHADPKVITILIGGALIYAVGALDDLKGLSAKLKFLLQILCAVVIYIGGIRIDFIKNPLYRILGDGCPVYIHFPLAVSVIITVIWIVGITNTINLIDGLDGLAAGVAAIASGYISYAAVLSGQYGVGLAMIAVTGAALGFLPFNFHPAKTFMGDSGSLYLGFMIASISVLGSTKGATLIVTIVPFLALGLPIFDTIFAIIRRWINGTPIMGADKGHVHHRIMNTGIGQRRTVLIMYCISAIMGMVAIMLVRREILESLILTVVGALLLCVFVADHSSLRAIMQEGIPQAADPKKKRVPRRQAGNRNRRRRRPMRKAQAVRRIRLGQRTAVRRRKQLWKKTTVRKRKQLPKKTAIHRRKELPKKTAAGRKARFRQRAAARRKIKFQRRKRLRMSVKSGSLRSRKEKSRNESDVCVWNTS